MGCQSNYQKANQLEIENSKVLSLLEELKTGQLSSLFGDGHHKLVYNKSDKEVVDASVKLLCNKLKKLKEEEIKERSLELQLWWREHKKEDKERKLSASKSKKDKIELDLLKKTLTPRQFELIKNS